VLKTMSKFESHTAFQHGLPHEGFPLDYVATLIGKPAAQEAFRTIGNKPSKGAPRTLDFVATWKIMAAHVHAVQDESHGAARPGAPLGNFELMCGTMVQGRNLADGLSRMARFARVMKTDMQLDVKTVRGNLHVSGKSRSPLSNARETYTDGFAMVLHCVVRWLLEAEARVMRVRSSALLAPRFGTSLGLFCSKIEWQGTGFTLVYDAEAARAPFAKVDVSGWMDGAYREFRKLLEERQSLYSAPLRDSNRIADKVSRHLIGKPADQSAVAKAMGMSVATLRRRLTEEGHSFRALASDVKRDAAEMLLNSERSAQEIAADIGLSDSRCLRRACRSWFGRSPSQVRIALRQSLPARKARVARIPAPRTSG